MFKRQLPQYVQLGNVLCSFGFSQGWNKIPCVRWDFIMEAAYIAVLLHNFFLLKHSTYLSCSNTNRLAYRQWIISAPGSAQTFFFWLLDFFFLCWSSRAIQLAASYTLGRVVWLRHSIFWQSVQCWVVLMQLWNFSILLLTVSHKFALHILLI